jgi:hypothetical protein
MDDAAGVVTVAVLLNPEGFPAASRARTWYWYVVDGVTVVSECDVTAPIVTSGLPFR